MSLLTPPSTTHRRAKDKENRDSDSHFHVAWSEINKIHVLQLSGAPNVNLRHVASKNAPGKPILKKTSAIFSSWPEEKQRETTPEPADPLVNLTYLVYPVVAIVQATDTTELRVLIEAYSILMSRLRASITNTADIDPSWPLFQPLRTHRGEFVDAVVRDLGRALVDPSQRDEDEGPVMRVLLPSPTNTPRKKRKDGMSAEQVKYARDLCTTSHAVMKLLSLVFTIPSLLGLFTDAQLRQMFTAVLAIPLADELPTPNARKTWALAIWLIQTQRLSSDVLAPAADRITLALCRGIDGELGKEGKKGSASDGLKAIHDLSIHLPSVFIPTFTPALLPSVLSSLLAPTLALRTQAAHALGGFVVGLTSLPTSAIHVQASRIVSKFLTTVPPQQIASPSFRNSPTKSPTKLPSRDLLILRTLSTTLQATEVPHVAHGPVWGICVLSSLLVLLGPVAMKIAPLRLLAQLGLRHKNRSVRALTSVMWRCVVWVFLQPSSPVVHDEGAEDEGEEEKEAEETVVKREEQEMKQRNEWWRLVASVTEFEAGVCSIAATIGSINPGVHVYVPPTYKYVKEEEPLRRALELLYSMVCKDAPTRGSAIDTLKALVCVPCSTSTSWDTETSGEAERRTLLPKSLFSAVPGLLSAPYATLKNAVNPIFDELPRAEDIRPLTPKEVGYKWVWDGLMKAWKAAVGGTETVLQGEEREKEKQDLLEVWEGLIGIGLAAVLDTGKEIDPDAATQHYYDSDAVTRFTLRAIDVIENDVLEDAHLHLSSSSSSLLSERGLNISGFTATPSDTLARLAFARELWRILCRVVPQSMLGFAAERLMECLMRNTDEYTTFSGSVPSSLETRSGVQEDEEDEANHMNGAWTDFSLEVLAVCGSETVRGFWGFCEAGEESDEKTERLWTCHWTAVERAFVWRLFAKGWMEQVSVAGWEGAVCILSVPFVRFDGRNQGEEAVWTLSSDDTELWQRLFDYTVATALDYGYDANSVLSSIVTLVQNDSYIPAHIRVVEFLLAHLAATAVAGELREFPELVLEFAAATMVAAYPPPQDQTTYTWAARAVTTLFEECPKDLLGVLGETMAEAVALWVGDADGRWDNGVIEYDILPMYQTILVMMQGLPSTYSILHTFGPILCAPFTSHAPTEIREPSMDSFREFWDATYALCDIPEGGWSEEVALCLDIVYGTQGGTPPVMVSADINKITADEHTPEPSPEAEQYPATPTSPIPSNISIMFTPLPSSTSRAANTLSTPSRTHVNNPARLFAQLTTNSPESPTRPTTPRRSHNSPWLVKPLPTSPESPIRSHSPKRAQVNSPSKRRKLGNGDKENTTPVQTKVIPSVLERLGVLASPAKVERVTLGKRRVEEEVTDSEDERNAVENLVAPIGSDDVFLVAPIPTKVHSKLTAERMPQKKRKRMILDAVEVPLLSEVYRRPIRVSASFQSVLHAPKTTRRSMRRSQSDSSALAKREVQKNPESSSGRKRRRCARSTISSDDDEDEGEGEVGLLIPDSTPLRGVLPWARSLLPSTSRESLRTYSIPSEVSSDDNLHIGQVTPHHLISPELKRGGGGGRKVGVDVADPPSDDSVMASSPSRDLLKRRLQRSRSSESSRNMNVKPFVV